MKSYRNELWFNVPNRRGFVLVNAMHITASAQAFGISPYIEGRLLKAHYERSTKDVRT